MINIVFYFPSANLNVGQNTCPGATDNTELLTTQAECLYCPYRSSEFQGDVHSGMGFAKPRNDLRQQICTAHADGRMVSKPASRRAKLREAERCLRQNDLCSQEMVDEDAPAAVSSVLRPIAHQGDAQGRRYAWCRLADSEVLRRAANELKRAKAAKSRNCASSRITAAYITRAKNVF